MSLTKSTEAFADKKADVDQLDPLIEVNESVANEISESEEEDKLPEFPPRIFGVFDVKDDLTLDNLRNAIYELGVVDLCWPHIEDPVFEGKTCFPPSYYNNSTKERLLLAYAENFRRQLNAKSRWYKILLLQAPNECGLQKMVCTTIRPTKLCYKDMSTWQGCASLVADFFEYEPTEHPMLLPERLMSPQTCLERRSGNALELATVLVSYLLGSEYDAYVVHGYATRDTTIGFHGRTECPYIPNYSDDDAIEAEEEEEAEPRYKLAYPPDMSSRYVAEMERREQAKRQAELDKIEAQRQREIAELEKPPPDDMDQWRTHTWVLILPSLDVEEAFFIEPLDGARFALDHPRYHAVHAVYNNFNFWVNMQDARDLAGIEYDLSNVEHWEHLLAGEPMAARETPGVDLTDPGTAVITEKHLDMPASWVEKLYVTLDELEKRYPGGYKLVKYKKVTHEKFSPYSRRDGLVDRVRVYDDYEYNIPIMEYNKYMYRADLMQTSVVDYVNLETTERFSTGREDYLKKHTHDSRAVPGTIEARRHLTFYYYARLDHLTDVVTSPVLYQEKFKDRDDRLESRTVEYFGCSKAEPRSLKKITEVFSRNWEIPAIDDIRIRVFNISEETIELVFHYAYNFVTMSTRSYVKPNLAETAGKILFNPEMISGYIADPNEKPPRNLKVYYLLCDSMAEEALTRKHIRDYESDVASYLKLRHQELTEPELEIYLFDTAMNEKAKKGWTEQELQKKEVIEREVEAEMDPLTPYLARMFGAVWSREHISHKAAALLREQCLNDFKAKQLARQNLVQERYDQTNSEYKNKKLWYLANQYILSPEKEAVYFQTIGRLAFDRHALEVRLTRHRDLSAPRMMALLRALNAHPLLKDKIRQNWNYY